MCWPLKERPKTFASTVWRQVPPRADPDVHPKLVTPAVLLMVSEDAPNGKVIQAGGGRFSTCAVFNNVDLELGIDADYEDLLEHKDQLLDMSGALEGWNRTRR